MAEKPLMYAFPITIEFLGILIIILGIAIELTTKADIGHFLISAGSALVALGSVIWAKIFRIKSNSFKGKKR